MERKDGNLIFKKFIPKGVIDNLYNKKFSTIQQIANELKVNKKTVVRYMKIHKISRRYKNWKGYKRIGFFGRKHTEQTKKRISEDSIENPRKFWLGKKNPKHSEWAKKYYKEHPEKHPNILLVKRGKISKPQKDLFFILRKVFQDATLNYPIPNTSRFADVGIPSLKLDIEYDEEYWHQDKKRDSIRDKEIQIAGWKIKRFNEQKLKILKESSDEKTKDAIDVEVQCRKNIHSFDAVDAISPVPRQS